MKSLVWVGLAFLIWRIPLFVFAGNTFHFISAFSDQFPYRAEFLQNVHYENWFWVWGNFDGVHYLRIAQEGYSADFSQVFFPLYPILVSLLGKIFASEYLIGGMVISYLAFFAALFILYKLIKLDWGEKTARLSIILLLLFPTSFYFGSIYTESLFLLFVLASFLSAKNQKWLLAGLFGILACQS